MTTLAIPLTQDKYALIDEEDFPLVGHFVWSTFESQGKWYAFRHVNEGIGNYRDVSMHRFLMDAQEGEEVDHINGNGLDNRRSVNLRMSTRKTNSHNRSKGTTRAGQPLTSQYKGVRWKANRWEVAIGFDGEQRYVGRSADEHEAARMYDAKARELHGEFALLNFPDPETVPEPTEIRIVERAIPRTGEHGPLAKLTPESVREIRRRYRAGGVSQDWLAEEYGVSQNVISAMLLGRIWKHVSDE